MSGTIITALKKILVYTIFSQIGKGSIIFAMGEENWDSIMLTLEVVAITNVNILSSERLFKKIQSAWFTNLFVIRGICRMLTTFGRVSKCPQF